MPRPRVRARNQQHLPGIEPGVGPIDVVIPTMGWEQIDGDMDPGTYGGTIATGDGDHLELIKIQPVREYVGDREAKDVGFPFGTRTAWFAAADLDLKSEDVRSALDSIGMSLKTLEDLTPEQCALTIASALLNYGRADEGPAGWSADIDIPDKVKWSGGGVAGPEYLADEDEAFRREVLLGDLELDYESYGPDKNEPASGLKVEITRGHTVEIAEWTDIEAANGEEQPEGEKIVKNSVEVELDELFDPKGKHRGTYSGDNQDVTLVELAAMDDEDREKASPQPSLTSGTTAATRSTSTRSAIEKEGACKDDDHPQTDR
jgi:hypothetical protein